MSPSILSLQEGCISVALSGRKFLNDVKFFLETWVLLTKHSWKHFATLKFKVTSICGLTQFCFWVVLYGGPWVANLLSFFYILFYIFINCFSCSFILFYIYINYFSFRFSIFEYHYRKKFFPQKNSYQKKICFVGKKHHYPLLLFLKPIMKLRIKLEALLFY